MEGFDSFTLVTPRSFDIITVAAADDGGTSVSGSSGGVGEAGVDMRPFEGLIFRDVREVTLDAASRDMISYQSPPVTGTVRPLSRTTRSPLRPGSLNAQGLEIFRIRTGEGGTTY